MNPQQPQNEPPPYRHPTLYWVALLVPFCVVCLALILVAVHGMYPRQKKMEMQFPAMDMAEMQNQEQKPERGFWEELFSSDRENPDTGSSKDRPPDQWTKFWERLKQRNQRITEKRGSSKGSRKNEKNQKGGGRGGPRQIARVANDDHLALRQHVLAEAIIRYRDGANPGGDRRIRASAASGPYRQQEEDRYEMERIWMLYHDGKATKQDLAQMAKVCNRMVSSKFVSFEDYASAGLANALSGEPEIAMALLSQALAIWPAKDRMRGDIYLFLTCMTGINGNDATFFHMLSKFKENFPDWLYVETYLPHLKRLKKIYPNTPVLDIIHGYVMTIVHNHAGAKRSYDAALVSGNLSADSRRKVLALRRLLIQPETRKP